MYVTFTGCKLVATHHNLVFPSNTNLYEKIKNTNTKNTKNKYRYNSNKKTNQIHLCIHVTFTGCKLCATHQNPKNPKSKIHEQHNKIPTNQLLS